MPSCHGAQDLSGLLLLAYLGYVHAYAHPRAHAFVQPKTWQSRPISSHVGFSVRSRGDCWMAEIEPMDSGSSRGTFPSCRKIRNADDAEARTAGHGMCFDIDDMSAFAEASAQDASLIVSCSSSCHFCQLDREWCCCSTQRHGGTVSALWKIGKRARC